MLTTLHEVVDNQTAVCYDEKHEMMREALMKAPQQNVFHQKSRRRAGRLKMIFFNRGFCVCALHSRKWLDTDPICALSSAEMR